MFLGRPKKRALRIYFATDIHGSDRCFRKFLAAAESYEADALVLGGDIAGKGLVPIRSHNGSLSAKVRGEAVTGARDAEGPPRSGVQRPRLLAAPPRRGGDARPRAAAAA